MDKYSSDTVTIEEIDIENINESIRRFLALSPKGKEMMMNEFNRVMSVNGRTPIYKLITK